MKKRSLQSQLDWNGKCLLSGRFSGILPYYKEVLPIYVGGRAILIDGHGELIKAMASFRERLMQDGVRLIKGSVLDGEVAETGRFCLTVEWSYRTHEFRLPGTTVCTYFCVVEQQASKIEMVEYKQFVYEDFAGWTRFDLAIANLAPFPATRVLH